MAQFGFKGQALRTAHDSAAANDHDGNMSCTASATSGPCLVTLESGIQALIEIAGFTYVEGVPVAIAGPLAEDVDAADLLERGPNGIRFKRVAAPAHTGPVEIEGSHTSVL